MNKETINYYLEDMKTVILNTVDIIKQELDTFPEDEIFWQREPSRDYKVAVYEAYLDGKKIEYIKRTMSIPSFTVNANPTWNWEDNYYRIAFDAERSR